MSYVYIYAHTFFFKILNVFMFPIHFHLFSEKKEVKNILVNLYMYIYTVFGSRKNNLPNQEYTIQMCKYIYIYMYISRGVDIYIYIYT